MASTLTVTSSVSNYESLPTRQPFILHPKVEENYPRHLSPGIDPDYLKQCDAEKKESEDVMKSLKSGSGLLGQIYYAFQESVLFQVFRDYHVMSYIPFCDLMGMEAAMAKDGCLAIFGGAVAKKNFIDEWKQVKHTLGWKSDDMESLKSLEKFETGYDMPRLSPHEFKKALQKETSVSLESFEKFKRFVDLYSKVEENYPQHDPWVDPDWPYDD